MKPEIESVDPRRLADELRSLGEGAALVDRSSRGKLLLRGRQGQSWLNRILSQDLSGLGPGDGCRALLLDVKGRVMADLRVYVDAEEIWIDTEPGRQASVLEELEKYHFRERIELADFSAEYSLFTLMGPKAPGLLAELLSDLPENLALPVAPYSHLAFQEHEQTLRVARPRLSDEPDFDLYWPRNLSWRHARVRLQPDVLRGDAELQALALKNQRRREPAFPERLLAGLRSVGGALVSELALEVMRIEAGRVKEGADLDEVLPPEAGLVPEAVALDKGCYPGQEVVQRMESRGRRRWCLVGLVLDGQEPPASGSALQDEEGRRVGWISSAIWSPRRQRLVALAYVKPDLAEPGAIHELELRGRRQRVEIRALSLAGSGSRR